MAFFIQYMICSLWQRCCAGLLSAKVLCRLLCALLQAENSRNKNMFQLNFARARFQQNMWFLLPICFIHVMSLFDPDFIWSEDVLMPLNSSCRILHSCWILHQEGGPLSLLLCSDIWFICHGDQYRATTLTCRNWQWEVVVWCCPEGFMSIASSSWRRQLRDNCASSLVRGEKVWLILIPAGKLRLSLCWFLRRIAGVPFLAAFRHCTLLPPLTPCQQRSKCVGSV